MQELEIKEILAKHHFTFTERSTIYGTIKPSVAAYNIGIKETLYLMKDHILHFGSDGIYILPVDDITGKVQETALVYLPSENIHSIHMKVKTFIMRLIIKTNDGDVEYKIRKSVLGASWHKENLAFLLLHMTKD